MLPEDTRHRLEQVLGESFELSHLHPWNVRFRRRYAQKSLSLPDVLKLGTASGRIFKLYVGDAAHRFEHMHTRANQAAGTGLFPEILWYSDRALLMEYLPGRQVDFRRLDFARDLGEAMARLHGLRREPCNNQRVKAGVTRDLGLLSQTGVLRGAGAYLAALMELWPADLLSSMDYTDIKPGNFIRDDNGRLRLIDAGAVRAHRPAGQYLCGSLQLRRINREAFSEAYLQAGGLPQVVHQARFLRMLHCIWAAALYLRKMQDAPAWLPLHRLGYRWVVGYLLWEFRRLAKRNDDDLVSL